MFGTGKVLHLNILASIETGYGQFHHSSEEKKIVKYNLGCGFKKLEGYINVDKSEKTKPDVLADVTDIPWKWAKPEADLIYMDNLIEHIPPFTAIRVIRECHRILKKGGILWMRNPELREGNLMTAFSDPTHVNWWTAETIDWFDCHHKRWKNYGRAYGIPLFERVENTSKGRFLIIKLRAVK